MSVRVIILLGPPGSGKGKAAEGLSDSTGFVHISTGDMLRDVIESGAPLGQEIDARISKGNFVPDEMIIRVMEDLFNKADVGAGFVLDGFPRTLDQAKVARDLFNIRGIELVHVFLLDASREILQTRLTGRRSCRGCHGVFNVNGSAPAVEGVCDHCGGELYRRDDDEPEIISHRMDVYADRSAGMDEYYTGSGVFSRIDATLSPKEVLEAMMSQLELS